ncbi:MAG: glycosyltransferase family 9 protein [Chthoniobacterales bacterium]
MGGSSEGKTALFRVVDAWFGRLACAVCTIWRSVTESIFGRKSDAARTGVLFIKLAEQGSTVLAATAIADAVHQYGAANIYFLVFEENRFVLDSMELIPWENVLVIKTGSMTQILTTALQQLLRIRKMGLLACVDLEFFARSTAVYAYLTGIPRRVGFHSYFGEGPWRGNLFTHRPRYNPHMHTSVLFRALVASIPMKGSSFPRFEWVPPEGEPPALPKFYPTPEEERSMRALIETSGAGNRSALVLLNANASDLLPLRRWDDANYVELAKKVLALSDRHYVGFTGAPSEKEKISRLTELVGSERAFCTAGKTTLRELLALYQLSDVMVTNDSGPAHFAALTDIDAVVLFGPETPALFSALSPRSHPVTANLACSPCVSALNNRQTACDNNVCMQRISVERVFAEVCAALERRKARATVAV